MAGFGGWLKGLGYRLADRVIPGNNYNRNTGQWSATPGQYATGIGGILLNLAVPGAGTLLRTGANIWDKYHDGGLNYGQPT